MNAVETRLASAMEVASACMPSSRGDTHALIESLQHDGYAVATQLIPRTSANVLARYARAVALTDAARLDDPQVPGTPSVYGDEVFDLLLRRLSTTVGAIANDQVLPTYSYFRVYKRGDVLRKHRDRPACEISATVNLASSGERPWVLWINGHSGRRKNITLRPGDACLYKGTLCAHWRTALREREVIQVFLHYVRKRGPFVHWRNDGRPVRRESM